MRIALFASVVFLTACATTAPEPLVMPPSAEIPPPAAEAMVAAPAVKNAALAKFYDDYDKAELALSPLAKSYRAIKDEDYAKLDQFGEDAALANRALDQATAEAMQAQYDRAALNSDDQLSYDLLLYRNTRAASIFPYRRNAYVFDQMNGAQADIPAFLINIHKVDSEADARAYIGRIGETGRFIDQAVAEAVEREKSGVLPPRWVFPQVIEQSKNIISGAPFDKSADNDLFADFKTKVAKLAIAPAAKASLVADARAAMTGTMAPAYRRMIALLGAQAKRAGTDDGIWRFKDGAAQYAALLKFYTTTDLDGDQVHALGLAQVARIHGEMTAIKDQVGFAGTLKQFFAHVRDGKQFYYPNTAAGKQSYLDDQGRGAGRRRVAALFRPSA